MLLAEAQSNLTNTLFTFLPLILIAVLIFFMFRARKRQEAQHAAMVTDLAPGTKVLLGSGFKGEIVSIDGDEADVEIAPGVVATVITRSIMRVDHQSPAQTPGDDLIGRDRREDPPASPIDER